MDKAELDDIRAKVALEPEGSLARLLLEELDRVHARMEEAGTAYARASLKNHHHLTNEEADKVMVLFVRGETPDMETGRCRACKGKGYAETIGVSAPIETAIALSVMVAARRIGSRSLSS